MIPAPLFRLALVVSLLAATAPASGAQVFCEPGVSGVMVCPCANNPSGPIRGCDNSLGTGGAGMIGIGTASISADTFGVTSIGFGTSGPACSGTIVNPLCAFYQGNTVIGGGAPFGDGVICCGGSVLLINAKPATNGTFRYPEAATDPSISSISASLGDVLSAGSTRCYFVGYRDSCPSFCTPSLRNKTNSFLVTWLP
jgi:hypothetical protein